MQLLAEGELPTGFPVPGKVLVAAVRDAFLALVVSAQQVAVGQGVKSVNVVEVQAQLGFQLNVVGQNVGHAQGGS